LYFESSGYDLKEIQMLCFLSFQTCVSTKPILCLAAVGSFQNKESMPTGAVHPNEIIETDAVSESTVSGNSYFLFPDPSAGTTTATLSSCANEKQSSAFHLHDHFPSVFDTKALALSNPNKVQATVDDMVTMTGFSPWNPCENAFVAQSMTKSKSIIDINAAAVTHDLAICEKKQPYATRLIKLEVSLDQREETEMGQALPIDEYITPSSSTPITLTTPTLFFFASLEKDVDGLVTGDGGDSPGQIVNDTDGGAEDDKDDWSFATSPGAEFETFDDVSVLTEDSNLFGHESDEDECENISDLFDHESDDNEWENGYEGIFDSLVQEEKASINECEHGLSNMALQDTMLLDFLVGICS
jgi:hypothetical protein